MFPVTPRSGSTTRPTARPSLGLAAVALAVAAYSTLQSLLVPVLPLIQADLRTTPEATTWTLTAWLVTAAVATPVMGRLGDLHGKRRVLLVSLAAVALGCLLAAVAPSVGVLIAARVVQGLGGGIFPLAYAVVRDVLPPRRVPTAIGAVSAVLAVGSGIGTVLAGPLSAAVGWRGLFLVPLVLLLAGAALTWVAVPATAPRTAGRLSPVPGLLLAGALVALLLPVSSGSRWGWTSSGVLGLLALSALLLIAWARTELRSATPLVDMRMMRRRPVWTANLAALLMGTAMFGVFAFLPRFVQTPTSTGYGFGATIAGSGAVMLPMVGAMAVTGFLSGPLTRVLPSRGQLVAGTALIAVAILAMAGLHAHAWELAVAGGVMGLGLGVAYAALTGLVVAAVTPGETGVATGMNTNLRTIGGAVGSAVTGALVFGHVDSRGLPLEGGYTAAFLVLGLVAVAATLAGLAVRPATAVAAPAEPGTTPYGDPEADADARRDEPVLAA
ncbi:MFS transporter [Lapillicoccus jejuensis]|uniref:Putative MFS family arabinose efflux permease n=1 Tax=Lapillicoccus jejuensis TaxID=402171 RepID=A0A542E687_9MICO|nr:MFS transporter [Lapillicoccus jejuensis]TQJ10799.1 putative MFS family arabinose efflux permease [Lapillicoccus jejuensis]